MTSLSIADRGDSYGFVMAIRRRIAGQARKALQNLFRVLNQKPENRDPYLADNEQK